MTLTYIGNNDPNKTTNSSHAQSVLEMYERINENLQAYEGMMEEFDDGEQKIKNIIRREIEEHGSNVIQIKNRIKEQFHKPLSSIDNNYIEQEYIKFCSKFWLTEAMDVLKQLIGDRNIDLQKTISSLGTVRGLSNIPKPFDQLKYYKLLIKHRELLSNENESDLTSEFKTMCFEEILVCNNSVRKELNFLNTLIDFLNNNPFNSKIIKRYLKNFFCKELTFNEFVKKIMDLETIDEKLQDAATCLQYETDIILEEKFKEVVSVYLKPTETRETNIGGRLVVEVIGKNIIISEILEELESKLSKNPNVEEVRFVGADIMHIDEQFQNKNWHGKNIVVLAKALNIHGNIIWDVSGKDIDHKYDSNAGTFDDGHGNRGKDGFSGESGGNVLILTYKIENPENFTLVSNGGNGSNGQDGGNGKDGTDGVAISKSEFDREYPSVVKFLEDYVDRRVAVKNTIDKIKNLSETITTDWYSNYNAFLKTETRQGNKITFSYCTGSFTTRHQAFLLYEGSLGQSGGHGGEYGLGGEGGYPGEITVKHLKSNQPFNTLHTTSKQGKEGEDGKGGLYGNHGKNGWDMYYIDYQTWGKDKELEFRSSNHNSKCTIEYCNESAGDNVWVPYMETYAKINVGSNSKTLKKHEERKSTRENHERQQHARAVRKKNISQSSILTDYSQHLNSMERNALGNLQSDLENTKDQALQAIIENKEQQKKQTAKIKIERHFTPRTKTKHFNNATSTSCIDHKEKINVDDLIGDLKKESSRLDSWFQLKNAEPSLSQLTELFKIFKTLKTKSMTKNSRSHIEKFLADKYRLVKFQEIAKKLPTYLKMIDNTYVTIENMTRYLVEKKENDNNISHPTLGMLNQYLYENKEKQREEIAKFCREEFLKNDNQKLKLSMREFITEIENIEYVEYNNIKTKYEKYQSLLEKEKNDLIVFPESYNKLDDECCKDKDVLKAYANHLKKAKSSSRWYMKLLAHIFDVNIKCYVRDQHDKLSIQNDHNPSSDHIVHILCSYNQLTELQRDENFVKLEEERKRKDILYEKIYEDIETLKNMKEFEAYLKKLVVLCDTISLENKKSSVDSVNNMYSDEENVDVEEIIKYFSSGERQQIKIRLEKLKFQYTAQYGILNDIRTRFSCEGKRISFQELCYLVNAIICHRIEDRDEKNIFRWIVSAYPQKNWTDELILLQLEDYFKSSLTKKEEWRNFLSKIENKDIILTFGVKLHRASAITMKCVGDIFYLLSNIKNETVSLDGLELSEWPYALKEKYWTCKLSKLTDWSKSDRLPTATYYVLSAENTFGTDITERFLNVLYEKKNKLTPKLLIDDILVNFYSEQWNLGVTELTALSDLSISQWIKKMRQIFSASDKERNVEQLVELIKGNANTSDEVKNVLPKTTSSILSINEKGYAINNKPVCEFTENDIKKWAIDKRDPNIMNVINKLVDVVLPGFQKQATGKRDQNEETINEMLAVIDKAIDIKRGFKLRDTQKLTILTLLTENRSILAQVSTGEGKSLIVVAASIIKALMGEKVNVITSSSVLAKRDAEDNKDLYSLFGISVSHNCSEDIEIRKGTYSNNMVVYGDLSNFQRDYLLDRFYGKNILGDSTFENVIVDEVDSMLLDRGNNILYLSHDLAGLDKLESLYVYIWQWINRPAVAYAFDKKAIKEAVLNNLYDIVTKDDIGQLGSELSEQQKTLLWMRLVECKILTERGILIKENVNSDRIDKVLSSEFKIYKDRLTYLLKECVERERYINIPNYLKPFAERHLDSWISSAIVAFFMKAEQDYVVDVDRSGTSSDRNPNITILDRDTGTDQTHSQWDEALHQFLQLKHGCKLSMQSLKAVFISNVSFFKLYKRLYGLTGTLGSFRERNLLREMYSVDFVTIPTAKSKQFQELVPVLCAGRDEWIDRLYQEATKITVEEKRSVLIICETLNDAETLQSAFRKKGEQCVHTYVRDYEKFDVAQNKELEQQQIIIATNLAGRGTDIKITQGLREAGGLHVCLTYLPGNVRIEQQAYGRAARCGDRGSGRLIIVDSGANENASSKILHYKKERDVNELHRISDIKAYYETQIAIEENCFEKFKKQFKRLNNMLSDKNDLEALLQSCLDKWAFWLDENSKQIQDAENEHSKKNINDSLNEFLSRLEELGVDDLSAWVRGYPVQMIKLGKYFSKNKKYDDALKLYDEVIKAEPQFSEAAHYYKAFILAKKIKWEQNPLKDKNKDNYKVFKRELRESAKLFDEHCKFAINSAGIIRKIKKNNNESIIQIKAYEEQKNNFVNIYYKFLRSIDDIFGHIVTPQSFNYYNINENIAQKLYEALLEKGVLRKSKVKRNIPEDELKLICCGYGVSLKNMKKFLSDFRGKDIDESGFLKTIKEKVKLPSREAFWKLLVQQEVFHEEIKYIIVDDKNLQAVDTQLADLLTRNVENDNLKKQTLKYDNERIILNAEFIEQQQNIDSIFKKEDFLKTMGRSSYMTLKKKGVLSRNKIARINSNKMNCVKLSCFDSISSEDFTDIADITENEAKKILSVLVKNGVLEKKSDSKIDAYMLKIKYDAIEQIQLKDFPVYENAVKGLLITCFTYRIALQKIADCLEEKNSPIPLPKSSKPHRKLLSEQKIIKPVRVAKVKKSFIEETADSILEKLVPKPKVTTTNLKEKVGNFINESADYVGKKLNIKENHTLKNVVNTLEQLKSSLKALDVPDGDLKSLIESRHRDEFPIAEETYVFSLNGLDDLLNFGEKRWTTSMLLKTAAVAVIGIAQIVIGAVIELYSIGFMTHVGAGFISEGVSDLLFVAGSLHSGYFSWKDYGRHKIESLIITAATVGIGGLLSRGAKLSRYGYKIAGPAIEIGGKKVSQMTGAQLIKNFTRKVVAKEMAKRILLKTAEGVAFGVVNVGIDTLVENHLRALCEGIAFDILNGIEQEIQTHDISKNMKIAYQKLGEEKARKNLNDLTKNMFSEKNCIEAYLPLAKKICNSVIQGISTAAEKKSKIGRSFTLPINIISNVAVWSERVMYIADTKMVTATFLDNLNNRLKKRNNTESEQPLDETHYRDFEKQMIDQWTALLRRKVGMIITQHIVSPILKDASNYLVAYAGRKIKEVIHSCEENENLKQLEELKKEYCEAMQNHDENTPPNTRIEINNKFVQSLLKLAKKTSNPDLYAAIFRENMPMDLTCVQACTPIIYDILTKLNVDMTSGLTVVVKSENGVSQTFSCGSDGINGKVIELDLIGNHFQLSGTDTSEDDVNGERKNDCLYDAISKAIPGFSDAITPEQFRNEAANSIERNPKIRQHITQGWHRFPLSLNVYGGDKFTKKSRDWLHSKGKNENEIGQFDTEWKSLSKSRIEEPLEYGKLKKEQMNKLPEDVRQKVGTSLTLHHIIPLSTIRDFLTIAAKDERGMEVINVWADASGLSQDDKMLLFLHIKNNVPLDAGTDPTKPDGLMPEAFKKLFWPKFNLVFGPSNRADDPGSKKDIFSSNKHPDNLRKMAKNLENIGDLFEHTVKSGKFDLSKSTCDNLTSSINNIRNDFTSQNKNIFPFDGNWQYSNVSRKWARVSTENLRRAGEHGITKEVIKDEKGGNYTRISRKRSASSER